MWPPRLRALELAHRGELTAAADLLVGDDPIDRYNRFVLRPAGPPVEDPAALRAALGPEIGVLVDVVRFSNGALAEPPTLTDETGEIAALVHATLAAASMSGDAPQRAVGQLNQAHEAAAPVSPGLAAQLRSAAADLRHGLEGPTDAVLADLVAAGEALDATDLVLARAELRLSLGSAYQQRASEDAEGLRPAIEQYLAVLRLVTLDSAPEVFAAAQVNLATAYLAIPMTQTSDQLRIGVAIQGLRTALTVYTPADPSAALGQRPAQPRQRAGVRAVAASPGEPGRGRRPVLPGRGRPRRADRSDRLRPGTRRPGQRAGASGCPATRGEGPHRSRGRLRPVRFHRRGRGRARPARRTRPVGDTGPRHVTVAAADGALSPPHDWTPAVWLGAPAPGGLALPSARPSLTGLYAPRGVWLGDDLLVVADTGNHRVLIWAHRPRFDGAPADVVLGQPDPHSEGPAAGGRGPRRGLRLPTGVLVTDDGRLVVADAWHHRLLVWDTVPTTHDVAPDLVLGQPDATSVAPNRGGPDGSGGQCGPTSLYWPFGIALVGGRFYVADTGNRRVLGWSDGLPTSPDTPPDLVLGQPDPSAHADNRGGAPGPASFRWPHDITGTDDRLLVADAGDQRLLGWTPHPGVDTDADLVLGQPDAVTCTETPYAPGRPDRLRFPYAADCDDTVLAVADTANNRVLLWEDPWAGGRPASSASVVLGQPSFADTGENRWSSVCPDTFCWPYGLSLHGGRLAVADSGNNRVILWERGP
nr:hypothetical protein [Candidatus Frankia nodulisporulans]